ncbi:hypothetical protein PSPO01_02829 [Paraphaeosphaeria sporulosa]
MKHLGDLVYGRFDDNLSGDCRMTLRYPRPSFLVISYDCVVNTQLVMHCMVTKSFPGADHAVGPAKVDTIVHARTVVSRFFLNILSFRCYFDSPFLLSYSSPRYGCFVFLDSFQNKHSRTMCADSVLFGSGRHPRRFPWRCQRFLVGVYLDGSGSTSLTAHTTV